MSDAAALTGPPGCASLGWPDRPGSSRTAEHRWSAAPLARRKHTIQSEAPIGPDGVRTRRRSVGWRSRKPVWPSVAHVYRLPARFARLPARLCVPVGSRPGMPAPGCLRPVFRAPLTPCPPLPVCLLAGSTHPPTNNPHQPSVPPLGDRATKGGGGQGPDQQPALRLLSVSRAFDRSALPEAGEARHRSRPQQQPDQPGGRSREPNPHMPIRHHRSNQLTYVHYPSKAGQRAAINDMTRL